MEYGDIREKQVVSIKWPFDVLVIKDTGFKYVTHMKMMVMVRSVVMNGRRNLSNGVTGESGQSLFAFN